MAQATLSVRMDAEDKKGLEEFCKAVGMNVSTAINIMFHVKHCLRFSVAVSLCEKYIFIR